MVETLAINTDLQFPMHKKDLNQDDFARFEHPTVTGAARIIKTRTWPNDKQKNSWAVGSRFS